MSNQLIALDSIGDISRCGDKAALLDALRSCASDMLRNVSRMAAIVRRLDELGVTVNIDNALLPYVRMIANGKLSAKCFLACSGDPALLNLATKLKPHLQDKIAANEEFNVLEPGGKSRMVPALDMNAAQLRQVFAGGEERDANEQFDYLERRKKAHNALDRPLPGTPGGKFTKSGERCPGCGAKLLRGAKCGTCELESKVFSFGDAPEDAPEDEADGTMPDGWQDRLAALRQVKEHGNELGFHVDWLLTFIEEWDGNDGATTLMPLLEKLSARFGYGLTEDAA